MDILLNSRYSPRMYLTDDRMNTSPRRSDNYFDREWRTYDHPRSYRNGEVASSLTALLKEQERLKKRSEQIKELEREMEEHLIMYKEHYGIRGQLGKRYAQLQYRIIQMKNENTDLQKLTSAKMEQNICARNEVRGETKHISTEYESQADFCGEDIGRGGQTRWTKLERELINFDLGMKRKFRDFKEKYTRKVRFQLDADIGLDYSDLCPTMDREYQDAYGERESVMLTDREWDALDGRTYTSRSRDQGESYKELTDNSRTKRDDNYDQSGHVQFDEEETIAGKSHGQLETAVELTGNDYRQFDRNEEFVDNGAMKSDDAILRETSNRNEIDDEVTNNGRTTLDKDDRTLTANDHGQIRNDRDLTSIGDRTMMNDIRTKRKDQYKMKKGMSPECLSREALGEKIIEGLKRNLNERLYQMHTGRPGSVLTKTGHYKSHNETSNLQEGDGRSQNMHPGQSTERLNVLDEKTGDRKINGNNMVHSIDVPDEERQLHGNKRKSRLKRNPLIQRKPEEKYLYTSEERDTILKNVKRCFIKKIPFCIYSNYERRHVRR